MNTIFVLMNHNNYNPSLLTHRVSDLYETYVQVFFSRYLFGPKGRDCVFNETLSDFTIRGHYLLSKVTNAHIESMFQATRFIYSQKYWAFAVPEAFDAVAAWLAGLLKQRYFLPAILRFIHNKGNFYYAHAWFGALFLFDDPSLAQHYVDFLKNNPDSNNKHIGLVEACLALWDVKYGTNHQEYIQTNGWQGRSRQYLRRFLRASEIFRANIDFQKAHQLQNGLTQLLQDTVSPQQYAHSLIYPFTIRRHYDETTALKQYDHYIDQYRTSGKFVKTPPLTDTAPTKIYRTTHQFENEVRAYLQNPNRQAYFPEINKAAWVAYDAIDILAGLEIDLDYQLPAEIVDLCYQKLLEILPRSFYLYEAYAIALLMRGNQHDAKAKTLYEKAQQIKAKYQWVEKDDGIRWGRYVKVK